jgi:tetratricopeptide (TPR) repeat protein
MFDPYNMKTKSFLAKSNNHPLSSKFLLLLCGCLILIQANSQVDKRLALADQYFSAGDYYTAAGLYGQFLHPIVKPKYRSDFPLNTKRNTDDRIGSYASKSDILFKQAESYRLANYWNEASTLYKQCFEKDSVKYSLALYWLAVCQRSTCDYTAAEESLQHFFSNNSTISEYYNAAVAEKQTLQFIKT